MRFLRPVTILALLQCLTVFAGILIVTGIFKLSGYNEWKDTGAYAFHGGGVFVRNFGILLFLPPMCWLGLMLFFERPNVRPHFRTATFASGWILLMTYLGFFFHIATHPYRHSFDYMFGM